MRDVRQEMAFVANRAEEMRRWPTKAERLLWEHLEPLGFERQACLGVQRKFHVQWYILDFFHRAKNVCVEVDGGYHKKTTGADRRRAHRLFALGIVTVRVLNEQVLDRRYLPAALERIREALK